MNKKGMTLLELMVYMVLAALLLVPIMMLMNNSSINMTRDTTRMDLMLSGRDVLNVMYDDIRNVGFKMNPADPNNFVIAATNFDIAEVPPLGAGTPDAQRDSSSFFHLDHAARDDGLPYDELDIIKGRIVNNVWDGVDTVTYFVDKDKQLIRARINLAGATKDSVILARNVVTLQFEFSDSSMTKWWYDKDFDPAVGNLFGDVSGAFHAAGLNRKKSVQFIRVSLVLKDDKQLAPARMQPFWVGNYEVVPEGEALYERHQIVIPVPNNGVFPPK